jgi:CRP/FNR family transcriptional regulator
MEAASKKYWHLRNHKLFWVLSNKQVKELCVVMRYKTAEKGDMIYFSEGANERIYILKKGFIKIAEIDEDGNENITDVIRKGDIFGELFFENEDSEGRNEVAIAISNKVEICSFTLSDFQILLKQYPSVGLSFHKIIGWKFKKLKRRYSDLIFRSVKDRLKIFLAEWAGAEGVDRGDKWEIENYLKQEDIAKLVCSTRQTTTSLLKELEKEGLIEYSRKTIVVQKKIEEEA